MIQYSFTSMHNAVWALYHVGWEVFGHNGETSPIRTGLKYFVLNGGVSFILEGGSF